MAEKMWRFPDNRYTDEKGLDTSDMETFKKDPVSSLAREICQNSIDAAVGDGPVKVEFCLISTHHTLSNKAQLLSFMFLLCLE